MDLTTATYYQHQRFPPLKALYLEFLAVIFSWLIVSLLLIDAMMGGLIQSLWRDETKPTDWFNIFYFVPSVLLLSIRFASLFCKQVYVDEQGLIFTHALSKYFPFAFKSWQVKWQDIHSVNWASSHHTALGRIKIVTDKKAYQLELLNWAKDKQEAQIYRSDKWYKNTIMTDSDEQIKKRLSKLSLFQIFEQHYDLKPPKLNLSEVKIDVDFKKYKAFTASLILSAGLFFFYLIGGLFTDDVYITDVPRSTFWLSILFCTVFTFIVLAVNKTPLAYNSFASIAFGLSLLAASMPALLIINNINAKTVVWQTQVLANFDLEVLNEKNMKRLNFNLSYEDGYQPNQQIEFVVKKGQLGFFQTAHSEIEHTFAKK